MHIKLKNFVISVLRRASKKWEPIYAAANRQKRFVKVIKVKDGVYEVSCSRPKKKFQLLSAGNLRIGDRVMWECEICKRWFFKDCYSYLTVTSGRGKKKKTVRKLKYNKHSMATDHVEPVIPVSGWDSWESYIIRLFEGKVQYLCNYAGEIEGEKSCHHKKTIEENKQR